tara:strand:+ start:1396 stop:1800 length:405 start_codon:yes stop_codon:yes gene_type:complete
LVISLVGCSTPVKRIEISTSPVEKVPLELPKVTPFQLENIEWILVTENNIDKVFAELEKKKYDPVVFGVSDRGYESLSLNLARIRQMVEQQRAIIIAYEKYYKDQNELIDQSNTENKNTTSKEIPETKSWWKVW